MIRNSRRVAALAVAGAVAIAPVISGCGAGTTPQSADPTQLTEGINAAVPAEGPAQVSLRHMFLLGPEPGRPVPAGSSLALYGVMINQVRGQGDRLVSVSSPQFADVRIDGGSIPLPAAQPDGEGGVAKLLGTGSPNTQEPQDPGDQGETPLPAETGGQQGTQQPTGQPTGPGSTAQPTQSPTSRNTAEAPGAAAPTGQGGAQPRVVLQGLKKELLAGTRVPVRLQFENAGALELKIPLVPHQQHYQTYPLVSPPPATAPGNPQEGPGTQQSPEAEQTPGGETPGTGSTPGAATTPGSGPGTAGGAGDGGGH